MTSKQWLEFQTAAKMENQNIIIALIVDSPWIPGLLGLNHMQYYLFFDKWLEANLYICKRFPEVIFIPGFWIEYGMATEPSGFGSKITWSDSSTPIIHPVLSNISGIGRLEVPNPKKDGLMPFALQIYERLVKYLDDTDHVIKIVAARGPLTIASWLLGISQFMRSIKKAPQKVKQLLKITTATTITWLKAQMEVLPSVEGIMVLDDIPGLISPDDCKKFAFPYLTKIFKEFRNKIRIYHNDANTFKVLQELVETGFDIFNFSHEMKFSKVREITRGKVTLMGNISPLEVLSKGDPKRVKEEVKNLLEQVDSYRGVILSAGGGISPGTPSENIDALVEATHRFRE